MIDVSSSSRPDTSWDVVDAAGHSHRWYVNGEVAQGYDHLQSYSTPTLRWVKDETGYWEDGESYDIGHYECRECGERVEDPRYTADSYRRFMPGLASYEIDGRSVSQEDFDA